MIHFELHTIDWNAISAIATTLALIFAYWSIHASNKQAQKSNEFQLKLLKKENEQKGLDEFIHKVIEIYDAVNPLDILNYSSKFMNNKFTDQDTKALLNNIAEFAGERGSKSVFGEMDVKALKEEYARCELGDGYSYDVEADSLKKMKFILHE